MPSDTQTTCRYLTLPAEEVFQFSLSLRKSLRKQLGGSPTTPR